MIFRMMTKLERVQQKCLLENVNWTIGSVMWWGMQALDSLSSHTHNLISNQQHFLLWAHQLVRFSIKLLVS